MKLSKIKSVDMLVFGLRIGICAIPGYVVFKILSGLTIAAFFQLLMG